MAGRVRLLTMVIFPRNSHRRCKRVAKKPVSYASYQRQLAERITIRACTKAALVSGGLALPSGPWGFLGLLPEIAVVCTIQTNMIADIAGLYGKSASMSDEKIVWCLFKHSGAQGFRGMFESICKEALLPRVGKILAHRTIAQGVGRLIPVVGAIGVGAFAYRDTQLVAQRAMALFCSLAARHIH